MIAKFKKPALFALSLLPIAIVAGVFVGFYQLDTLADEVIEAFVAEVGSLDVLIIVSAAQTLVYALLCGFLGYILADKLGLWRPLRFERDGLLTTLAVSLGGGIVFSLDYWLFGSLIEGVRATHIAGLSFSGVAASVLYGGIIEEVMLRLFFMSLIAYVIWKLFYRKCGRDSIPGPVFTAANIVAALVFAAGHLPSTFAIFGLLSPLILLRCFLLNGGFGLIFGWLYRKYGILYAMLGHAMFHLVSKLIWFVFI